MENEEVLIFPSRMVKLLEIENPWLWNDDEQQEQDEPVISFDNARICLSREGAVLYPTLCGVSSMNQLERIARFRDIMWIDLVYENEQTESFFVPYEDEAPSPTGSPNRLMEAGWDEAGDLWIFITASPEKEQRE